MKKRIYLIPYQKMTEEETQQISKDISILDDYANVELCFYEDEYELSLVVDRFSRKYKKVVFIGSPELIDRVDSNNIDIIFDESIEELKRKVCNYILN